MKIQKIASSNNEKIKYLKKLGSKKERDVNNEFLIENIRIIHDAIKAGYKPNYLFVTEELLKQKDKRLEYIFENISESFVINENTNKSFSSLKTPSGICTIYNKQKRKIDLDRVVVYLNGVSDPGNMGSIIRTAIAFGIENLVVDEKCVDIYNPKTISAARDGIFKINILHDKNTKIFSQIKENMRVYVTSLERGKSINSVLKGEEYCIVLGNEANGVDDEIMNQADDFIKINMTAEIESLNVAVSAGIIFYEIYKISLNNKL